MSPCFHLFRSRAFLYYHRVKELGSPGHGTADAIPHHHVHYWKKESRVEDSLQSFFSFIIASLPTLEVVALRKRATSLSSGVLLRGTNAYARHGVRSSLLGVGYTSGCLSQTFAWACTIVIYYRLLPCIAGVAPCAPTGAEN